MARLDPEERVLLNIGLVRTQMRAPDPGAGRIPTQFIDEFAADDEDFLPTLMNVSLRACTCGPTLENHAFASETV